MLEINKYFKIILSILLLIIIIFVGVGCMNQNSAKQEIIKEKMYEYACDKYSQDFSVVNFEYAVRGLDANRSDILTLSDGKGFVFNVTHSPDDKDCENLYDDYNDEVLEQKFADYFKNQIDLDVSLNTVVMLEEDYDFEEINSLSVPKIINKKGLVKIIILVSTESEKGYILSHINDFYDFYNYIISLNPKYIDFEIVVSTNGDSELANVFSNPRIYYENDWNSYSNVKEYLSVDDVNLDQNQFAEKIVAKW